MVVHEIEERIVGLGKAWETFKEENQKRIDALTENKPTVGERNAIEEAFVSCIEFLICEQGWECFRSERLYRKDEKHQTISAQNAETLRRFIRDQAEKHPRLEELVKRAESRE